MKKDIMKKKNKDYENNQELISFKEEDPNEISHNLKIDDEIFIIKFKKRNNKISIFCNPIDEFASLYDYSIDISYEEFCKLGKNFKMCENIDDIFKIIKNIVEEVKFTKKKGSDIESNIRMEYSSDDIIYLLFKIPLLTGTYEEIKIEFKKTKKDVNEQFSKLKEKYFKIKKMVINNDIKNLRKEFLTDTLNQINLNIPYNQNSKINQNNGYNNNYQINPNNPYDYYPHHKNKYY